MRFIKLVAVAALLGLTGCAQFSQGARVFADGVNKGVARTPDARVDATVHVEQ